MTIEEKAIQQYTFNDEGQLTGEPIEAFYEENALYLYLLKLIKERSPFSSESEQRDTAEFFFDEISTMFAGATDASSPEVVFETFMEEDDGVREWEDEILDPIVNRINGEIQSAGDWEDEDYIKDNYESLAFEDISHNAEYDSDVLDDVKKMGAQESDLASFLEDKKDELDVDFKVFDHYSSGGGDIVLYQGNLGEESYALSDELKEVMDNVDDDEKEYIEKHIEGYLDSDGNFFVDRSDVAFSFSVSWTYELKDEFEEYLFDNQVIEEIPEE